MSATHRRAWLATLVFTAACGAARADAVTDWNANAAKAAQAACLAENPLYESRMYAMVHTAVHDALNTIEPHSQRRVYTGALSPKASPQAAVAAAAHDVIASEVAHMQVPPECNDAAKRRVDADYAAAAQAWIGPRSAIEDGIRVGREAAAAVILARTRDGSEAPLVDPKFPQGTQPGQWRFTPGSPPVAVGTQWGKVKPFVLKSAEQFRPGAPLPVDCSRMADRHGCEAFARDVEEVRRLGGDGKSSPTLRTPDQSQIAVFWEESSPTSWNRMARDISARKKLDLWANARLFALLNSAMADGYIASWSTKFHYLFWRPATAVRAMLDPQWNSLHPTPPVPDYESAHAVQGGAAAAVMRAFFGTDRVDIAACSNTLPEGSRCGDAAPVRRHFDGLGEAARENGLSRIYIGFHFRDAVEKGLVHGDSIGRWTFEHAFQAEGMGMRR